MKNLCTCLFFLLSFGKILAQLPGDLIINEILFNPPKDGYDYVELYNRSDHAVPLSEIAIANRNGAGEAGALKSLTKDTITLQPQAFVVLAQNEKWLKERYNVPANAMVIQLALPSFPDDEGAVVLLKKHDSSIVDELHYDAKWHFKLLTDVSGVALERTNYEYPGNNKNYWTSASSSSGYGTPGVQNSQYITWSYGSGEVSVLPKVLSPNNDGINDVASIDISMQENGHVANSSIYDMNGRRVKYLIKNALLGKSNRFMWDGYDENRQRLPCGIYIVFTQIFDMNGNNRKFRNCIVLDTRLK